MKQPRKEELEKETGLEVKQPMKETGLAEKQLRKDEVKKMIETTDEGSEGNDEKKKEDDDKEHTKQKN